MPPEQPEHLDDYFEPRANFAIASARVEAPSFFAARCINTRTVALESPSAYAISLFV